MTDLIYETAIGTHMGLLEEMTEYAPFATLLAVTECSSCDVFLDLLWPPL